MRWFIGSILSVVLILTLGCTSKPEPQPTAQSQPAAGTSPVASEPVKLACRRLDLAAAQELSQAFGKTPQEKEAASKAYAGQRWRFYGHVQSLYAGEANRFNELTLLLIADNQTLLVRIATKEEKSKIQIRDNYLIEATVENFADGEDHIFKDAHVIWDRSEEVAGQWQVIAINAAGQEVPTDKVSGLQLQYTFAGGKLTIRQGDKLVRTCDTTFPANTSPRQLLMQQEPPIKAIYELSGNTLKLCITTDENPGDSFPSAFAAQDSPRRDLLTLTRVDNYAVATKTPSPTATSPSQANRTVWHYVNAPLLFPNQTVTEGIFRKQGEKWMEERKGGEAQDWIEKASTTEYIELGRPNGSFYVRLYTDRSTYRYGNEPDFKPMFPGQWE